MHEPDPVETILARLMPAALSDEGVGGIEAMLDELTGPCAEIIPVRPWFRRPLALGSAAAGIAAAVLFPLAVFRMPVAERVAASTHKAAPGFVLVSESGRVKSMSEEGWQEDADGSAMRTLRLRVVEENSLLDEETGIVMQVSEPRDEFLLMPVSTF
jgi:hypothetical protein